MQCVLFTLAQWELMDIDVHVSNSLYIMLATIFIIIELILINIIVKSTW